MMQSKEHLVNSTHIFECLFGNHCYCIEDYPWKSNPFTNMPKVLVCCKCHKKGYSPQSSSGRCAWYDYDDKGNMVRYTNIEGREEYFKHINGRITCIHIIDCSLNVFRVEGKINDVKPENWEFEDYIENIKRISLPR
jgi:YD repeat-containing protein